MRHQPFQLYPLVYQYQDRFLGGSLLYLKDPINGIGIEGIGPQPIQIAGGESDNPALLDDGADILNYFRLGIFTIEFINFQSFWLFPQLAGPSPV